MRALGIVVFGWLGAGCNQLIGVDEFVTGGDDVVTPDADLDAPDADPGAPDAARSPDADLSRTASVQLTWTIADNYAADGNDAGLCPPSATRAKLTVDGPINSAVTVDCSAGTGLISGLPLGEYGASVTLTTASGTIIAEGPPFFLALANEGATETLDLYIDGYNGLISASWDIVASACGAGEEVSVISTISGTTNAVESIWPCATGEHPAVTDVGWLPVGSVIVSASLLDASRGAIGSAPAVTTSIPYGHAGVTLGPLQITRN